MSTGVPAFRRLRILLICSAFLSLGGISEVVYNLAQEFGKAGHEVRVLSTSYVIPGAEPVFRKGIKPAIVRIPAVKPVTWRHPERLFPNRNHRELARRIGEFRPDLVNCHVNGWDRIPTIVRACRAAGVVLVYTLHDCYEPGNLGTKALRPLKFARAVTTISEATRRDFQRLEPSLGRAVVITDGVDVEAAQRAEPARRERPYVFCAARLKLRSKAIDVLIAGFRAVAAQYPELDLLIAGGGPDAENLQRQIAETELGGRVVMVGVVSREELWQLYKGALFYAMPSRRPEGLGLVFLESMACGRPVIGTRSGGTPEVVLEGETGLLLERNEPAELARAMRTMLDDADGREAMGRRGRELAAGYAWSLIAESYLRIYRSCLGQ